MVSAQIFLPPPIAFYYSGLRGLACTAAGAGPQALNSLLQYALTWWTARPSPSGFSWAQGCATKTSAGTSNLRMESKRFLKFTLIGRAIKIV